MGRSPKPRYLAILPKLPTCVAVATNKASPAPRRTGISLLAGAYIAMGAIMFTIITNDISSIVGDGLTRLIGGIAFPWD